MGNRKEQIQDLEREINQKQQTLNELKAAESRQDPDDPSQEVDTQAINEILSNI